MPILYRSAHDILYTVLRFFLLHACDRLPMIALQGAYREALL